MAYSIYRAYEEEFEILARQFEEMKVEVDE